MTGEPIFERVTRDLEHDIERGWGKITGHIHHARPENTPTTKGTTVTNIVTELHDAVTEGISNIEGWADDLKSKLPTLAAKAEKVVDSPIVQAVEELGEIVLPADTEQMIVSLIKEIGKLAQGAASAVTTAAASVSTDAGTAAVTSTPAPAAS